MKTALIGENRIREFRRVAKKLAAKLSSFEGVVGIAFIGGLVRGFADKHSDVDIVVLVGGTDERLRKQLYEVSSSVARRLGVDVDMEVHFTEDFRRRAWDEIDRWEFSKAKIVFDPNGTVREILDRKLAMPQDFWTKRAAVLSEYMKWYCCPQQEGVGTVAESWIDRGDLLSAHYCLNYAVDLLLKLVFVLNQEHLPAPKWRLFYSHRLKWLPRNYSRLIKDSMRARDFSAEEFKFRLGAIRKLWQGMLPKIEDETKLTMDELSKYFVEKVLRVRGPQI